ncbi:MAG TPA: ACT domain-containing protein [Actinomycetota bacterium]
MTSHALVAVTVVGTDQPGIVAGVTKTLYDVGCNLEDASSAILRGHFTMTLIVGTPGEMTAETLEYLMQPVAAQHALVVTVRDVEEVHVRPIEPTHMVSVYGADKPGIVFRVADALAGLGANITDLTSRVIEGGDAPVYALMMEVAVTDPDAANSALEHLRSELGLEVSVSALDTSVL